MNCKKIDYEYLLKDILIRRNRKTPEIMRCDKQFRELLDLVIENNDINYTDFELLINRWEHNGGEILTHKERDYYCNAKLLKEITPAHNQDEINNAVLEIVKKSKKGTTLFNIATNIDFKGKCKYEHVKLATLLLIKSGKLSKNRDDPAEPLYFVQKEVISK